MPHQNFDIRRQPLRHLVQALAIQLLITHRCPLLGGKMKQNRVFPLALAFSLLITLSTAQPSLADPSLPLPRMPICGDQSEPPVTLHCPDFAPLTDVQLYTVPGTDETELVFDFVYREASYNNELGFFLVDDQSGRVGEWLPGNPEYFAAALDRATIVFRSGSNAYTPDITVTVTSGQLMVFFIIQNNTTSNFLANNPTNSLTKSPLAFFSIEALNPDSQFDHFIGFQHLTMNYSQFGFEDQTNGGDKDYDDVVYTISPPPEPAIIDSDGDGLPDIWETDGLDTNLDGQIDLDLQAMGANKDVKDIFVWIDWLEGDDHSHRPSDEALNLVKAAFAKEGIQLHTHFGRAIPETSSLLEVIDFIFDINTGNLTVDFNDLKDIRAEYFLENGTYPGRASVFHYALFAHNIGKMPLLCPRPNLLTPAGYAIGSDFVVGLNRALDRNKLTPFMEAIVFMHELGHTLGLGHGGVQQAANGTWVPEHTNSKPNHLSIMNYSFGTSTSLGLTIDGVPQNLDYSRFGPEDIPNLNEYNLNETVGLNASNPEVARYQTRYYCRLTDKTGKLVENINDPIDWNCDGDSVDENLQANINKDTNGALQFCSDKYDLALSTSNEWQHLNFRHGTIGTIPTILPDYPSEILVEDPEPEMPIEELLGPSFIYLPIVNRTTMTP